jgi:GNAT superfamily N-acetyltransferase
MEHEYHSYLGFMYVDPAYRGKGINKLILNSLKCWSKAKNVNHLYLEVYADNKPAVRAYEKAGFENNLIEMRIALGEGSTILQ